MNYDFTTKMDRSKQGSSKWALMYRTKEDVSKDIVPLSVADMEFKHPKELIDGLKNYLDEVVLGYTFGDESFKDSVVSWMKRRRNFEIKPEWIVNTPGVVPAIFNAVKTFSKEGDGIVVMPPVYYPFYNAIKVNNRKVVECPLIENDGHYTIDYEKFDTLTMNSENKILIFCSPHNPVGKVWTKEELLKLAKIIKKNKVFLLCDEIHFDLILKGNTHTVFQTLDEEIADNMITFTAPSKTFNLAGMGISNIIIKNDILREKFQKGLEESAGVPHSALGYKACEIAYNECESWLDELLEVIDDNQKMMKNFFEVNYPKIKCPLIEGTYLQWVDFRDLKMTNEELENFMINEAELFLDEGYIFGENGSGFERFNLAVPKSVLNDALKRLDIALKKIGYK